VGEDVWLNELAAAPVWRPDAMRLLIVAPHPDDETLGAGGLIADARRGGVGVTVVCATDGEHAYLGEDDPTVLAGLRREEQAKALGVLGVAAEDVVRLALTDSNVSAREQELAARITDLADARTIIVAPWEGDFHPDHEACGRAARAAAERTGAELVSYFFWTWHRGTPESVRGLNLVRFPLSEDLKALKLDALAKHTSQLYHGSGEPVLPKRLLGPANWPFEAFALQ
jgi:LmbE family N-acetylglucosaminyl deacetylase